MNSVRYCACVANSLEVHDVVPLLSYRNPHQVSCLPAHRHMFPSSNTTMTYLSVVK